jgi:hypothetical protein
MVDGILVKHGGIFEYHHPEMAKKDVLEHVLEHVK